MNPISPDLQQNILVTLYLLFTHNYVAMAYAFGAFLGLVLAVWKPSRFAIFVFVGFLILLFSFEYDKHIVAGLREQTLKSLFTVTAHYKASKIVNLVLTQLLPIVFYMLGWGMVFGSIVYAALRLSRKKNAEQEH